MDLQTSVVDQASPAAVYVVAGIALLAAAVLPRVVESWSLSPAMVFLAAGILVGVLPETPVLLPTQYPVLMEHATEFVVIIALMGVGLSLDRPLGWRRWRTVWRLILLGMPLMIAATAWGYYALVAIPAASALLLGAALAPTDPVLATDVQVGEPTDDPSSEDELRFSLTAEGGLNDALAFPFVWAAILLSGGPVSEWFGGWLAWELVGKFVVGAAVGAAVGLGVGFLAFRAPVAALRLADASDAIVALAVVFLAYGIAEALGGYGFLAVFGAAVAFRASDRGHEYHVVMHGFVDDVERILTLGMLLVFGYFIGSGLLSSLTWPAAALGLLTVLVIRPVVGWVSLTRLNLPSKQRLAIAFFGVKGIGSLYYISFALTHAQFPDADLLWATVAFTVITSIVVHGGTATPVMRRLDRIQRRRGHRPSSG